MQLILRYWPHLAILAALAGAVAFYGSGRYDAGYLDGSADGYKRGADHARALADKETAQWLAETRAEAARIKQGASEHARAVEARQEAAIAAARVEYERAQAATAARAGDLERRLRDLQRARAADHLSDRAGGLPEAAEPSGCRPALADWLVHERGGIRIAQLARRADEIADRLAFCEAMP